MTTDLEGEKNRRILLVDDQTQLHEDYAKILDLTPLASPEFDSLEADFFGSSESVPTAARYELTSAFQGAEGVELVKKSLQKGLPFALAFMDVRMPPGIDGIEATERIFALDPEIQVVISTAYADYAWETIHERFGENDRLLFLRKPFDATEVLQIASTLSEKWTLSRQAHLRMEDLEQAVKARTEELGKTIETLRSTQGRLIRSEKLASLGKLIAGLTHEINTPAGVILSSCDTVSRAVRVLGESTESAPNTPQTSPVGERSSAATNEQKARQQKARDALEAAQSTIVAASQRIGELVNGLSRFSHLDGAEKQWLDLRDSVRTVLTILEHRLLNRIVTKTEFEDVPSVSCHPGEIHQLLLGLLENAIEAIDGDGQITVRVLLRDANVAIDVEDTGRGMTEEQIGELFEIGLHTAENRVQIDWGLHSIQQILADHGGDIAVRSKPGTGSTFTAWLPVKT